MIDTLKIYTNNFKLSLNNAFQEQTTSELSTGEISLTKTFCNTIPNINLTIGTDRQTGEDSLYVSASLPKLLYKTNYFEIKETDCERAIETLQNKIVESGVSIENNNLDSFKLSRLDFCRNIEVDRHIFDYLVALQNFDMSGTRLKQQFKSETITFYNKSQEFTFYNKIKEIKDKEFEPDILSLIQGKPENILRVESRLKKSQVIKREIKENLKVSDIFNYKLCKDNLLKNMDKLIKPDIQLEFNFGESLRVIKQLRQESERGVIQRYLYLVGLDNFLKSLNYDYELVRKFLVEAGYKRSQIFKIVSDMKTNYQRYSVEKTTKDLIKEIRDKISA